MLYLNAVIRAEEKNHCKDLYIDGLMALQTAVCVGRRLSCTGLCLVPRIITDYNEHV